MGDNDAIARFGLVQPSLDRTTFRILQGQRDPRETYAAVIGFTPIILAAIVSRFFKPESVRPVQVR
jgi:hypothetical protein